MSNSFVSNFPQQYSQIVTTIRGLTLQKLLRRESLVPITAALKWILGAIAFVLLAMLIYQGIGSLLRTSANISELEQGIATAKQRALPATLPKPTQEDYTIVSRRNIFGPLSIPTPAGQIQKPVVQKSPLTLIGTFLTEGQPAYAIIEDDKKKVQDAFGVNDPLFGEGKVVAIYVDRVEIERGGERETLTLDDNPGKPGGDFKGGIAALDGDRFIVEEAELDRALENLPLLLTQARAVPYFRDGRAAGLRLFALKSGSLYEKLGLKNGDILKGINGNSLADLSQAMQLFEKLKSERTISVVLERNSEEKEFKYDVR